MFSWWDSWINRRGWILHRNMPRGRRRSVSGVNLFAVVAHVIKTRGQEGPRQSAMKHLHPLIYLPLSGFLQNSCCAFRFSLCVSMSSGRFRTTRCRGKFKNGQLSRRDTLTEEKKCWIFFFNREYPLEISFPWMARRTSSLGCRTSCGRIRFCRVSFMPYAPPGQPPLVGQSLVGRFHPLSVLSPNACVTRLSARVNATERLVG